MRKNYVENSLKRFLKRKVKITMGVVVSFLITGAVAFAVDNSGEVIKGKLEKENTKIEEIEGYLKGFGSSNLITKDYTAKKMVQVQIKQ